MTRRITWLALLSLWLPSIARAQSPATFALIIGVNQTQEPGLVKLRYADDDAARYQDLFRALGVRTVLLSQLDENTRRLHVQAAAEALPATLASLRSAVETLRRELQQARERGLGTRLYVVYAGHGNVEKGEGYILLEDARLTAAALQSELLGPLAADDMHLIVDACYSFYLAFGRGPGGTSRPVSGFSLNPKLAANPHLGLLLSTSSARESHEWDGVQAGIFHHEVQSGLMGAADADGDGKVSYREMGAFVARANAAIPNERFRPDVFLRPPEGGGELADLRGALGHRLEIDGQHAGRYSLEDTGGVRLADLHNAPGQPTKLVRPAGKMLFLRRLDDEQEFRLEPAQAVLQLSALSPERPRVVERGAAHESFMRLFELPFGEAAVSEFSFRPPDAVGPGEPEVRQRWTPREKWAVTSLTAGALAGAAGIGTLWAASLESKLDPGASQRTAAEANARIQRWNDASAVLLGVAGTALISSAVLWLWPEAEATPVASLSSGGGVVGVALEF